MPPPPPPPASLLYRHRQLSPSANIKVSPLCLGTMTFGESGAARYGEVSKDEAFNILDTFYGQGGNFLDTANGYQNGESEEWIGEWMTARGVRDEMVVATKFSTPYMGKKKGAIQSNYVGNGSKSMKLSVEASLKKLQTSYIDILYVHWWDCATSIEELMHSLNDLVVAGKVLYLGVSDTPAWVVAQANQYAKDHGLRPFVVYQGMWNASLRDFERDIIPMCRAQGMGLAPYGTLNQGRFQTKAGFEEREKDNPGRKFSPVSARDKKVSAVLEKLADKKGCQLVQVALAYCLQKTPYVFPIVGGRKVDHIQGSIDGLAVELTEDEVAEVEDAYPFDHGFPHTFLSGTLFEGEDVKPRQVSGPHDNWANWMGGSTFDWVDEQPKALRPFKAK